MIPPTPAKTPGSIKAIANTPSAGNFTPTAPSENSAAFEDDSDEPDYAMKEDYFKESEPTSNRHKWLIVYYKYLFTPTAGFHQHRNRLQHAGQVKTILDETDPKGDDIVFLTEEEGNRVWIDWVVPNLRKKAAGTLKSYLTSLQMFLEYVTKKGRRPYLPSLSDEDRNTLSDLAGGLKGWRRHITEDTSSAKWDKYLDECEHLLTNQQVDDIMNSEAATEGRKALVAAETAVSGEDLTIAQYCAARDMLIAILTRYVGARPGSLETAMLDMFAKAKWDEKRRKKVMIVTSHKREEDGPAPIPMDADTVFLMEVFIKKLRPTVSDDDSPNGKIFLKKDGAPFHKGTIRRRLTAFVVKSGIRPDTLISHTHFRKWIVTEMQKKKRKGIPIDEDLLRRLMCHSDKTAKLWYMRDDLTEQAAEASTQIAENTKPSPCKKKPCHAKKSEETDANTQASTSKMKLPDAKDSEQIDANTNPLTSKMKWPECKE